MLDFKGQACLTIAMKTSAAIEHFGSVAKLAEALGITRKAIYQWPEDVPKLRAYELERITGGVLRVEYGPKEAA